MNSIDGKIHWLTGYRFTDYYGEGLNYEREFISTPTDEGADVFEYEVGCLFPDLSCGYLEITSENNAQFGFQQEDEYIFYYTENNTWEMNDTYKDQHI